MNRRTFLRSTSTASALGALSVLAGGGIVEALTRIGRKSRRTVQRPDFLRRAPITQPQARELLAILLQKLDREAAA